MTDKQIIDEVDVSKCKYNNNGWCLLSESCDAIRYRPCGDMTLFDCYYRNWQRKEQECEALQMSENEAGEIIAELQAYKDVNEDFKTAWEELKAENDELKKIINEAKSSKLDLQSFLVGEAIQNEYEQQLDQLKAKNEELKKNLNEGCLQHLTLMTEQQVLLKTLAEIKEIAEVEIECKTYEIENDCFNETRCKALNEHIDFTKQILQKISEVENDNK